MPWTSDFRIDHESKVVQLLPQRTDMDLATACNKTLSEIIENVIQKEVFGPKAHSELYPIVGATIPVSIERFSRSLFGIIARGAHLTVYTQTSQGIEIWVPRRASTLFTYPNCLDTTVAGGVIAGEDPLTCVIREGVEEASLSDDLVRDNARSCGVLSYMGMNRTAGGGNNTLITPDLIYVFDLEVRQDLMLKPGDDEVKEFYRWGVEKIKQALAQGEFKTNSALVMIDFLIRHGLITPANEKDYAEISSRMHRQLPFPVSSTKR